MTKQERKAKVDYLSAYRWLLIDLASIDNDLERMKDRLYSIRVPTMSDMPRGGRPRTMESNVIDKVDLERRHSVDILKSESKRIEIESAIASMSDARDRTILKLKFINGLTHEQIAEIIGYSLTQERFYYVRALTNFAIPTESDS